MTSDLIKSICWKISNLVATRDRNDPFGIYQRSRATRAEVYRALDEYPATFVSPPQNAYDDLEIMETRDGKSWFTIVPLWSKEEGESDMCLTLSFTQDSGEIRVSLDGCHVP